MRRTLAAAVVALSLAVTMTPVAASAATVADAGRTTQAGPTAHERATAALERAQALFGRASAYSRAGSGARSQAGHAHQDASLAMRDLFVALDDLSPAQRAVADRILARPTDGPNDPFGDGYTVPSVKKCQGHFCVHYVTSTVDAPPSQAWVTKMLKLMNTVWKKEVGKLGYHPPVSDRGRGGNDKFDVYLSQIGDAGLYGYCAPERRKPGFQWLASGYCVLDNDFAEFPLSPIKSAEVTAAHEFFHAIQFGYDYGEDPWLLEATATWMEERIYDNINDNRQYLGAGQLVDSLTPLDFYDRFGSQQYGNWVFFEFLSKNFGNNVVQQIWEKAAAYTGAPDMYSTQAISNVLKSKGGFKDVYARFVAGNLVPNKFYPEGKAWPTTTLKDTYTLTSTERHTGKHGSHLLHMSSLSWKINSSSSLKSKKWSLKVKIDGPKSFRMPEATVLVVKRQGVERYDVKLNGQGKGQVIVPFSRKKVKSVYVSLVNASTRFKCHKSYVYSCQGLPIDDGKNFRGQAYKFSASVIKS